MRSFLNRIPLALTLAFVMLVSFAATAFAAGAVVADDSSILDFVRPVWDAFASGHYIASGALALVLAMAAAKRYARGKFGAFIHSDVGGGLTMLLASFGATLAATTASSNAWHWAMLWSAGSIAVTAAGGYTLIKKLIVEPLLKPLADKYPWMKPVLTIVFWFFDKPDAIKVAEAAGAAAVAAAPAPGAEAATGKPVDVA